MNTRAHLPALYLGKILRYLFIAAVVFLVYWLSNSHSQGTKKNKRPASLPPPVVGVELIPSLVYGHAGDQDLVLDMVRPASGAGPFPAMVFVHAGGWSSGNRSSFRDEAETLAKYGVVCVTVDYRLAPEHRFPAQIEDLKCSVRWLRANATQYNIDTSRIGAFGHSSGAHLVALLGTTSNQRIWEGNGGNSDQSSAIQMMICHAAPVDLLECSNPAQHSPLKSMDDGRQLVKQLLGGTPTEVKSLYIEASPINYVSTATPPTLLLHGTRDIKVPFEQSVLFEDALKRAGVDAEFIPLVGASHETYGKNPAFAKKQILQFIQKHLNMH